MSHQSHSARTRWLEPLFNTWKHAGVVLKPAARSKVLHHWAVKSVCCYRTIRATHPDTRAVEAAQAQSRGYRRCLVAVSLLVSSCARAASVLLSDFGHCGRSCVNISAPDFISQKLHEKQSRVCINDVWYHKAGTGKMIAGWGNKEKETWYLLQRRWFYYSDGTLRFWADTDTTRVDR